MTTIQFRQLFLSAIRRWNENNATRMAAAIAFFAIMAVAPLLLFGIAVGSQFLDSGDLHQTILREARTQLGSQAGTLVQSMIDSARKPGAGTAASVISITLALFGASGLFDQLKFSINAIWEIAPKPGNPIKNYLISKLLSMLMVLVFVSLVSGWIGIDFIVSYTRHHTDRQFPYWHFISFIVSVGFLTGVFGVTFKSLPRGVVVWSDVWLPAFVTAVGFGVAKYLLSLYFEIGNLGSAYGPAGALVIVLLWFYYSSQIFFFGAELTFAYSHMHGSRSGDESVSLVSR